MKHVKNVFLVLVFALSAAAFSTSAMAASNPPPPPDHKPGGLDIGDIVLPPPPDWCKNYPQDKMRPSELGKICQWNK
ncbi:PagK family vesicle-borne virulence factor [Salmonella enterica subsp. diarizonae]